ncbi:type VI secretion system-associated FHA domain protein TagH [Enterovirga aerilata]|uniref:Type VI secretion system-associated FHA domain protein TagH n=1 Tax=Enterovirga aerilata TaxID=2730920 RepID=A0A849IL21_9HYPH|nr:type VI secretion system-associated FHA domain protein TagH [Enterovirga sp. DB1703]NNM74643.1 type VI secretion system-associated FHA domain protein TagH [Enterovirga sp. DB1703]
MAVHLTIENETSLPDGGPLSYTITGKRGIDIGRDAYLDWCLPDPTRTVSGKHCEIRYRDGGYWLHDVSRNGTFLNRSASRMQEAHRLRDGDRIEIGRYMILVRIDGEEAAAEPSGSGAVTPAAPADYWNAAFDAAPPISPRELRPARESRPVQADFREWAIDVPPPSPGGFAHEAPSYPVPPPPSFEDMAWAKGPSAPPPPAAPAVPMPSPRRPVAPPPGTSPWDAPETPVAPASWTAPAFDPPPPAPAPDAWPAPPPPTSAAEWAAPPLQPVAPPASDNPWGRPSLGPDRARAPGPVSPVLAPDAESFPTTSRPAPGSPSAAAEFVARFAKGAGVPADILDWRDPGDMAEELGVLTRLAAENLKQLLSARAESKRAARTGSHTMIQALDNNPLKFSPTIDDALKIMLGRPSSGYLDARRALEQSFKDLKVHQVKTYSAMQHALRLLMEDLDPAAIEESIGGDRGIGGLLGSKKAKLWDLYVTRWDTLTSPHEDGMVDAFMMFFAECYDRGGGKTGGGS